MAIDLLCSLIAIASPPSIHDLPYKFGVDFHATHRLHHGQMFEVVMCLKESVTGEELYQDTADAPYVARVAPSKIEDDFGRSVVPGGHHRRMIFVIEGCRPEVN